MNQKTKHYFIVFFLATFAALVLTGWQLRSERRHAGNLEAQLGWQKTEFDSLLNQRNQTIARQAQNLTQSQKDLDRLSAEVFALKQEHKVHTQALVRVEQLTTIDTLLVPFTDTLLVHKQDTNCLSLPAAFQLDTAGLYVQGQVQKEGLRLERLWVSDTISLRLTERKTGLFKRSQEVEVLHSSAWVKTRGVQNMVLKKQTSAWNRWLKPTLAFVGGAVLAAKLVQ